MRLAAAVEPIVNLLLGPPGPRRVRSSMTLIPWMVYALFAVFQHLEVVLGLIDPVDSWRLTTFNLVGITLLFLAVRSGLSERWSQDPSLTGPQMVFAICSITWSYAITGPARGAVMGILIVVILFGMFGLKPQAAWRLAAFGFGMLASAMLWRAWHSPERYDPRVELIHFIFAAIVMGATATVAVRLGRLRAKLSRQRGELEQALAVNRELATRDSLTGLLNRRAATELLAREHPRLVRGQGPLALALLDIDHFKRINDQHGHHVGDEVLRRFAACIAAQLREADALARWGGEEFLLVMPGTRATDAMRLMERLRRALADDGLDALVGPGGVTFSAGLVQCGADETQDAAIARADQALYRAKQAGRDRVEMVPAAPAVPAQHTLAA
jgi:diguanylate cyclase